MQAHRGKLGGKGNTSEAQAAKGAIGGHVGMLNNKSRQASARIMAAKGMTQKAIAEGLGVSDRTIRTWLNPEKQK